jgi:hypothetical protein
LLSPKNLPTNSNLTNEDFTLNHYRDLLKLAKIKYNFASYKDSTYTAKSLLWRHDVDFSLERSLVLAKIEYEEGIKATYFINPHSEFYNLSEKSQVDIVKKILKYGHTIGLHFDSAFYENNTNDLDRLVIEEASYLVKLFGEPPVAFSFHNPNEIDLQKEEDQYGGITNCYSRYFKNVAYCSDANGYWRFKRLHDFLEQDHNSCVQVCTHAGWWHEYSLPPRIRILRAAYARANKTIKFYDEEKRVNARENFIGSAELELLMSSLNEDKKILFDYLLCYEYFQTLILELWQLHHSQIKRLFSLYLKINLEKTDREIDNILFKKEFSSSFFDIADEYLKVDWVKVSGAKTLDYDAFDQMILDATFLDNYTDEDIQYKCIEICQLINKTSDWALLQNLKSNGLN